MNRWLRLLLTILKANFRKPLEPDEETSLDFRVWISDVDLAIVNNGAMLALMETGRWDLMVRTGFLKHALKEGLYLPLASIYAQFRRPLKRFQKFQLKTQLIYWDDEWIYLVNRIVRKNKTMAIALAKVTLRKGRERIPFDKVIDKLNWGAKPKKRPEMIDDFEKGAALFFEDCEAKINGER